MEDSLASRNLHTIARKIATIAAICSISYVCLPEWSPAPSSEGRVRERIGHDLFISTISASSRSSFTRRRREKELLVDRLNKRELSLFEDPRANRHSTVKVNASLLVNSQNRAEIAASAIATPMREIGEGDYPGVYEAWYFNQHVKRRYTLLRPGKHSSYANLTGGSFREDLLAVYPQVEESLSSSSGSAARRSLSSFTKFREVSVEATPIKKPSKSYDGKDDGREYNVGIIFPARLSRSRGMGASTSREHILAKFQFLAQTLPAVLESLEMGYNYTIYIGIDRGDRLEEFVGDMTDKIPRRYTPSAITSRRKLHVVVKKIEKDEGGNYVKVVNAVAKKAFNEGMDYIARYNDDSLLKTKYWTTKAIRTLQSYTPPNIGVVGPTCHQGATAILTHDFIHRAHYAMMGFHYPWEFKNWYSDDWITKVYRLKPYIKINHAQHPEKSIDKDLHPFFQNVTKKKIVQPKKTDPPGTLQKEVIEVESLYYHLPAFYYEDAETARIMINATRYTKLPDWEVVHTLRHGTRYVIDTAGGKQVEPTVEANQKIMQLYLSKFIPMWKANPLYYEEFLEHGFELD